MTCYISYIFVALIIVLLLFYFTRKEHFSIAAERNYRLCPAVSYRDKYLMPNSIEFVIQGYNYALPPTIIRGEGGPITPLQYAWDSREMSYYIVVYSPKGLCSDKWILKTSEDVEPVITEGYSQKRMKVSRNGYFQGYHYWNITC
jgi:hypothetical protein